MNLFLKTLGMDVDLDKSTSKCAKIFAMEWFHQTTTRGVKYQRILLGKILKNIIWKDVLPNFVDLENA